MKLETLRLLLWVGIAAGAIIAAICAFFVNVVGQKITEKNEQIVAQREAALNRPLIQVAPKRFDNKQFLKATLSGKGIFLESQFEVKNTGNVPTKFIRPSPHSEGVQMLNPPASKPLVAPVNWDFEGIALSPGESKIVTFRQFVEWSSEEEARFNLQKFVSQSDSAITVEFAVVYSHPADDSRKYKTIGRYRIGLNEGLILKVDYQDLSDSVK